MPVKKLTGMALLVAIGIGMGVFSVPVGGARIFPVQHAINVIAAVLYGPLPAMLIAFCVAALRVALATGTIMAFPGGMIGALTAGIIYRVTGSKSYAAVGEVFGTGVIGAVAAFPLARFVLGRDVLAFTYIIPFAISSLAGATMGLVLLRVLDMTLQRQIERV